MLATPEQLATPLASLPDPSATPALSSPTGLATFTSTDDRAATWSALEARLDALEQAEVDGALEAWEAEQRENAEEMDEFRAEGRLAERLRERREGKRVDREGVAEEAAEAVDTGAVGPAKSRARYLLERLVDLAPKAEGEAAVTTADQGSVAGAEEAGPMIPRGIAVRDEWRSLLLACVSLYLLRTPGQVLNADGLCCVFTGRGRRV